MPKPNLRCLLNIALLMLALVASSISLARAQSSDEPKRRVIPITINKGENYTITDVKTGEATKVVSNPNALVVQTAPGRIELVGADAGSWNINATLSSGEKVTYAITVKSTTNPQGDLNPGAAPPSIQ